VPSVSWPQSSTDRLSPGEAATAVPSIARPATEPLPCLAETLLAETAPPNSETESRVTSAELHVEPLAADEPKATTDPYAEGPRLEAGVPSAVTAEGQTRAAAPAPTQAAGSEDCDSGPYAGVVVVVVVLVVVVAVVVVPVPSARAEPTPTPAATTAKTTTQTPRRIAGV
jgi:hypothetical protein